MNSTEREVGTLFFERWEILFSIQDMKKSLDHSLRRACTPKRFK